MKKQKVKVGLDGVPPESILLTAPRVLGSGLGDAAPAAVAAGPTPTGDGTMLPATAPPSIAAKAALKSSASVEVVQPAAVRVLTSGQSKSSGQQGLGEPQVAAALKPAGPAGKPLSNRLASRLGPRGQPPANGVHDGAGDLIAAGPQPGSTVRPGPQPKAVVPRPNGKAPASDPEPVGGAPTRGASAAGGKIPAGPRSGPAGRPVPGSAAAPPRPAAPAPPGAGAGASGSGFTARRGRTGAGEEGPRCTEALVIRGLERPYSMAALRELLEGLGDLGFRAWV